nr:hypothetical protein [Hyphomonadaceae bacterium]
MRGAAANHGLPDTLVASLNAIADWLYLAGNPDHVMIGSAALAILLQGKAATADDVGDIDLVLTSEGATNLINAAGQTFQPPGASDRFRSAAFARLSV